MLSDRQSNLVVNGVFRQLGDLEVTRGALRVLENAELGGASRIDGSFEVSGGDLRLLDGSLTNVQGQLNVVPVEGSMNTIILDEGSVLTGSAGRPRSRR